MAKSHKEIRRLDAGGRELWDAALQALDNYGFDITRQDQSAWLIEARTGLREKVTSGSADLVVRVYEGAIECSSEMRQKYLVTDWGITRRHVEGFLSFVEAQLTGATQPNKPSFLGEAKDLVADFSSSHKTSVASQSFVPPTLPSVPTPVHSLGEPDIFLGEFTMGEEELLTIAVDDYPLDNQYGSSPLQVEQELRRTVTTGASLSKEVQIEGALEAKLGIQLFDLLNAEIRSHAKTTFGIDEQKEITRSHRTTFTVAPRQGVLYRVTWKQKTYPGEIPVSVDGVRSSVPFGIAGDLEYSVSTHPLGEDVV